MGTFGWATLISNEKGNNMETAEVETSFLLRFPQMGFTRKPRNGA